MRKVVPLIVMATGAWVLAAPWLYQTSSMGSGRMMGGMTHSGSGVVVDSSTYYWHIVPGVLAIALAVALLLSGTLALTRWVAGALLFVAVWIAVGPWVLPRFGLGNTMNMGLSFASSVRHIVPGVVLAACAAAAYFMLPAGVARETPGAVADPGSQQA